jgi:FtsP/CotA-like multicopper oxidase with cupredoxin domain
MPKKYKPHLSSSSLHVRLPIVKNMSKNALLAIILFAGVLVVSGILFFPFPEKKASQPTTTNNNPVVTSGSRFIESQVTSGIREFQLSAKQIKWEISDGVTVDAFAYNGQVPGPEFRVKEGEKVRIVFKNELPEETTIHWHGVDVPFKMDGIPGMSQEPIKPGETFVYEFEAKPSGTFWYHTHVDAVRQLDLGLSGAFVIEAANEPQFDQDYTMLLDEWIVQENSINGSLNSVHAGHDMSEYNYFTINGKAYPAAEKIKVKKGDKVRLRFINAGYQVHPMHLHGKRFTVFAKDGAQLPQPYQADTINVAPGERYDISFIADGSGEWMLHCHNLHHTANNGIEPGGLMTTLEYTDGTDVSGMEN